MKRKPSVRVGPLVLRDQTYLVTPRQLLFHSLVHEIRHWAQVALATLLAVVSLTREARLCVRSRRQ